MLGDFDISERLREVGQELCERVRGRSGVRAIAVYPEGMDAIILYDGRAEEPFVDPELHRKLIDALGAMLGRLWFVIDCRTERVTMDEIETARQVVRALNQIAD